MQENVEQLEPKEISLSQIFQNKPEIIFREQGNKKENEPIKPEKHQSQPKDSPKAHKQVAKEQNQDNDSDVEDSIKEKEDDDQEEASKESSNHKAELENTQKKLKDTQKWGNDAHRKLSSYVKKLQKYQEESILTEEEAKDLLDYAENQQEAQTEKTSFERWGDVWDKEVEYIRKYSSNPEETNRYVWAFQHFMQNAPKEEVQDAFEKFQELEEEKDEVSFTKKMLEIGKQWNDDIFNDIVESGSLRNLKAHYSEKEKKLQNRLDKALKEVDKLKRQYEDYSEKPNLGLPSGSSPDSTSKESTINLGQIFSSENRYKPRK